MSIPNVLALAGTSALGVTSSSYSGLTSKATFVITYVTGAGITGRIDYSINSGAYTGTATITANPSAGNATITVPINAALQGTTPAFLFTLKDSTTGVALTVAGGATLSATDKSAGTVLLNSGLGYTNRASNTGVNSGARSTAGGTGKLYYEITLGLNGDNVNVGYALLSFPISGSYGSAGTVKYATTNGYIDSAPTGGLLYAASANTDVLGFAIDTTAQKFWLRKNGTWLNGDPVAGTGGFSCPSITAAAYPFIGTNTDGYPASAQAVFNFSAAAPSGFSTINSFAVSNVTASSSVPVTYPALPLTVGINAAAVGSSGELSNDLMDYALLAVSRNSSFRYVANPSYIVNDATAASHVDATDVAMDSNYMPTRRPFDGSVSGYVSGDNVIYYFGFSTIPAQIVGTYDVSFHPSIVWTSNSDGAMTLTNYNQSAGTATLTIGSPSSNNYLMMTAFAPANAGYFRAIKQGSTAGKRLATATKTSLGGICSTTNRGFIRWMGAQLVNRQATTGFTLGTYAGRRPSTAVGNVGGDSLSHEAILESCIDTNTNPWVCIPDIASAAQVTAIANFYYTNMPTGMKLALEYSNEMWNFQFSQAGDLNTRATAASVSMEIQYAREYKTKVLDPFEAVFGVNSAKLHPVLAWQANRGAAFYASMLNEGSIYTKIKGLAIGPYVGGGLNGHALGDYNEVSVFTQAQRNTVITPTTGKATFKTNFFAAQQVMSDALKTTWTTFCSDLATYCVSKGMAAGAIRPAAYETYWQHIITSNTPTASSQDTLTFQAFAEALRDSRAGTAETYMLSWLKQTGGDIVNFAHLADPGTSIPSFGSWGFCNAIGSEAQEPYASTATWITANT